MKSKLKVKKRGFWFYREKELTLTIAKKASPDEIELLFNYIDTILRSNKISTKLSQVVGNLNPRQDLVNINLGRAEDVSAGKVVNSFFYKLYTKFFEFKAGKVFSDVITDAYPAYLKNLETRQILRQVGFSQDYLSFGIKFYSNVSSISKWFNVPIEEGSIRAYFDPEFIKFIVILKAQADTSTIDTIQSFLDFINSILNLNIEALRSTIVF